MEVQSVINESALKEAKISGRPGIRKIDCNCPVQHLCCWQHIVC